MRILDPPLRHHDMGRAPRVSAPADRAWLYRAAFWAMLGTDLFAGWGIRWDLQWHRIIGRDSFWIAPHIMIYTGVVLTVAVSISAGVSAIVSAAPGLDRYRVPLAVAFIGLIAWGNLRGIRQSGGGCAA